MLTIEVWKQKIFPEFSELGLEPNITFPVYIAVSSTFHSIVNRANINITQNWLYDLHEVITCLYTDITKQLHLD